MFRSVFRFNLRALLIYQILHEPLFKIGNFPILYLRKWRLIRVKYHTQPHYVLTEERFEFRCILGLTLKTIFPQHCAPFQIEMNVLFWKDFAKSIFNSKIHVHFGVEFILKLNRYLKENKILRSIMV